jgi:hypothetical protein
MPAGSTYSTIATTTLGSATNAVTFSSIASTYTDLVLIFNGGVVTGASDDLLVLRFNSDSSGNYSNTFMVGNGSSASSGRNSNYNSMMVGRCGGSAKASNLIANIQNYANTTTFKSVVNRANVPDAAGAWANVGLWRSTSAITSVTIREFSNNNFDTGATFTLYGIAAA